jgi:hypothetical protein
MNHLAGQLPLALGDKTPQILRHAGLLKNYEKLYAN